MSTNVGKSIITKSVEIFNGLEAKEIDGRVLWSELKDKFPLFLRGDESQEITQYLQGVTDKGVTFHLFEFMYVNVDVTESEDNDGNKKTKTTRTIIRIYGLLTIIPNLSGFSVNTKRYKIKWTSTSKIFNKKFKVYCDSELNAAKFFTPSTVLKFEDHFNSLRSIDVRSDHYVCIETESGIIPSNVKAKRIKNTEEFLSQLENPKVLLLLNSSKELIDLFYLKSNNNIRETV